MALNSLASNCKSRNDVCSHNVKGEQEARRTANDEDSGRGLLEEVT